MKRVTASCTALLAAFTLGACDDGGPGDPAALSPDAMAPATSVVSSATVEAVSAMIERTNATLESAGAPFRLGVVEYITDAGSEEAGATVLAKSVGNKHLGHDYVPFDPRRAAWSGPADGATDDITYAIDQSDGAPLCCDATLAQATAAIEAAMATWDVETCSALPLTRVSDGGLDLGFIAASNGLGGSFNVVADLMHAGFSDVNYAGGVLAATHTFIWVSGGSATDINGDGRADVAFREINYDPSWFWAIGYAADIESIALHEAGHGLSQAHFGSVFQMNDGSLHASPRAVMNALYTGVYADLAGSDRGGHCSDWSEWPAS